MFSSHNTDKQDGTAPDLESQRSLSDYQDHNGQCSAIAVSTGRRCRRNVVAGTAYCGLHIQDLELATETSG